MSDNYCRCKGCKHIDPNERSGYKWYCTWYRSYEDPDCIRECRHYDSGNTSSCFLTSACCQYKGLPDDCSELTILRAFRDNYLLKNERGCELVEEYYRIAPDIVDKINSSTNKDTIYEMIYINIHTIITMIEKREYNDAILEYKSMVLRVQKNVDSKCQ